ncbi:MAG: GIY-YIG nuclease family protein [Candidatus Omnitrophica bacterium]|nr:GIY-YIG nuclease family protein [Candidatus Omnitrophota bacterium]
MTPPPVSVTSHTISKPASGWQTGGGVPSPACQGGANGYVYVIQSVADGKFYVGVTGNLQRRLDRHNQGTTPFTRNKGPWRLVGYELYQSLPHARSREQILKRNPRMRFFFIKRAVSRRSPIPVPRSRRVMG